MTATTTARADRGAARARARREGAREAARARTMRRRRRDGADGRGRTTTDARARARCATTRDGDDARARRTRRERRGARALARGIWNLEFGIWNSKPRANANATRERRTAARRLTTTRDARAVISRSRRIATVRSRIQSQFAMIRRHQSLLDAYAGDGWRGAASQKPKPLGELASAREKIFKGKSEDQGVV